MQPFPLSLAPSNAISRRAYPRSTLVCAIAAFLAIGAALMTPPAEARISTNIGVNIGGPNFSIGVGQRHGFYPRYGHWGPGRWGGPRLSVGLYVPLLPIGYSTYWYGGSPYYSYRDEYYVADGRGYRVVAAPQADPVFSAPGPAPVVAAPPSSTTNAPTPVYEQTAREGQLYAYPRNGQSESNATFDRIECETWGTKQTGYHPGQSADNVPKKSDYQRAVVACLEGRGYSVK